MSRVLREYDVPALYLLWSARIPAIYLGPPFRRSRPSHSGGPLTVAYHPRRGPGGPRAPWSCTRARFRALPGGSAGGRQVPPLVFSVSHGSPRGPASSPPFLPQVRHVPSADPPWTSPRDIAGQRQVHPQMPPSAGAATASPLGWRG
jgi:hypothetical protein